LERYQGVTVVYEELCRDPLNLTQSLFQFLGWPMGAQTREFVSLSTGLRHSLLADLRRATNRYFGVYKDRTKVLESWKTELTDQAIKEIISIASRFPGYRNYWPE
jgi:hypothetical protein